MRERISIKALRTRAYEAIAVKGGGSIGMSRSAGQQMLALVEAVETAQMFADNWRGSQLGPDTFGQTLAALRSRLARFDFGDEQ